jgi:integrase/recombinase XerD
MGQSPTPAIFSGAATVGPRTSSPIGQRSYRRLFTLANITKPGGSVKRCHPHMFRDTFAVEMLLAGVPIDQVSILLGHASVRKQVCQPHQEADAGDVR